jgi:hypothetical protein
VQGERREMSVETYFDGDYVLTDDYRYLERQLAKANRQMNVMLQRLQRHELALWLCADKCCEDHMPPEGQTPTQMVCEFVEEAERRMKEVSDE